VRGVVLCWGGGTNVSRSGQSTDYPPIRATSGQNCSALSNSPRPSKGRRGALSAQEARSASRAAQIEIDVCSSNFPRRARDTNSGNPVMSRDRETNIRVAENKIYHGPATPSFLWSGRCLAVSKSIPRSQVSPAHDVLGCCHPSAARGARRRSGILQVLFGRMLKAAMRLLSATKFKLANFANAPNSGRWRASNNAIDPVDQRFW
jgi:hypothetical protein